MKLSVIIVSYNVRHYLQQCLDSLQRAIAGMDAEVCIVDNHSKDGTVKFLRKLGGNVKVIESNHNYGFARANNIGIRQTSGDYVLLLNPDTVVGESTIKDCLAFMDGHPSAGGLGVEMLKSDGGKAMESRRGLPTPMASLYKMCGLCSRFPNSKRFGRYYMCGMAWDEPGRIEVVSGAFFMIRRTALEQAGLLDEDFFRLLTIGEEGKTFTIQDGEYWPILPAFTEERDLADRYLVASREEDYSKYWLCRTRKTEAQNKLFSRANANIETTGVKSPIAVMPPNEVYDTKFTGAKRELDTALITTMFSTTRMSVEELRNVFAVNGGADVVASVNEWYATWESKDTYNTVK